MAGAGATSLVQSSLGRRLLELMHSDLCDCETQVTSSYHSSVKPLRKPREPPFLC